MQPLGKIPAKDKKTFSEVMNAVINQWGITTPSDIMVANRMVSTWMKMRYVESCIEKYGLFFEDAKEGKVNRIRVNELAYYLKQLEADFRSYCRMLGNKKDTKTAPTTFLEMLDGKN